MATLDIVTAKTAQLIPSLAATYKLEMRLVGYEFGFAPYPAKDPPNAGQF